VALNDGIQVIDAASAQMRVIATGLPGHWGEAEREVLAFEAPV
jgi:hypothetical protein